MREEDESPNDRNDRGVYVPSRMEAIPQPINSGIRKATAWYNSHISLSRPPVRGQAKPVLPDVVLLTDDAANRQKAEKEGIKCMSGTWSTIHAKHAASPNAAFSVRRYIEGTKDSGKLLDLLSTAGSDDIEPTKAVAARQSLYPDVCDLTCRF